MLQATAPLTLLQRDTTSPPTSCTPEVSQSSDTGGVMDIEKRKHPSTKGYERERTGVRCV